ncbi:MAG TPA: hypothetical protein VGN86_13060 [Pyrinomonadaceae bacterium]|nr:hypothetical protein [Pyrinomonadaceae bacterium]
MESFENEKLEKINDVTRFELKDELFGNGGDDSRWTASVVTADLITFEPVFKARNSFTWKKVSKDLWEAILNWPATDTKPARQRIYRMERWPKAQ